MTIKIIINICSVALAFLWAPTSFAEKFKIEQVKYKPVLTHYLAEHPIHSNNFNQVEQAVYQALKRQKKIIPKAPQSLSLSVYPIGSIITPGKAKTIIASQANVVSPIFVIGDDALSKKWLRKKGAYLRHIHATGYVVSVENLQSLQKLHQLAPEIDLIVLNGDMLEKVFHIKHYPTLILPH